MYGESRRALKKAGKNRILIVEGMDRCGKGTFIKKYLRQLATTKIVVMHCDAPPSVVEDKDAWSKKRYYQLLLECKKLWNEGFDIVLDRSHIGEYVYGYLYRGTDPDWVLPLHDYSLCIEVESDFYADRVTPNVETFIFVDSPENSFARDDGLGLAHNVEQVAKEYERWLETADKLKQIDNKVSVIDWSTEAEGFNETLDKLVLNLTKREF